MPGNRNKIFPDAEAGDLQVSAPAGSSVLLGDRSSGADPVGVTASGVSVPAAASAAAVLLGGEDVWERIGRIPLAPGVSEGGVGAEHIAPGSLSVGKVGGVVGADKGGTGRGSLLAGRVVAVSPGGGLEGIDNLSLSAGDGGLSVDGSVLIAGGGAITESGEFAGRPVSGLHLGAPPSVAATAAGHLVKWTAADADGDARRVLVRYSGAPLAAEDVVAAPDDWFEADEGAAQQVFVGAGSASPPHYAFYRDAGGSRPLLRGGGGAMVLHAGRSYRFERADGAPQGHPFWVGASAAEEFSGFPVEGPQGRSRSSGIDSPGEFVQFDIPRGWTGALRYYCTSHAAMSLAFDVRPASAPHSRDPLAALSGSFDASAHAGSVATVVCEDSAGNVSDAASVAIP